MMTAFAATSLRAALCIAAGLGLTPVLAQEPGSRQTREFVQAAAQSDQFEILEANTVLAQSQSAQVRAYAETMIEAHRQTSANLLQAVQKEGLASPKPGLGGDQSMFLAALQSQRGADFDKTYLRQQVLAHRSALAVEQAYAASGDAAAIRAVATATVPIITAHLRMAEQMQTEAGGS
jgi:putative membrane protein